MKVAFVFGGVPHYLAHILNQINKVNDIEVLVYYPSSGHSIGKGVFQDFSKVEFQTFELKESRNFWGKLAITGIKERLKTDRPDILVVGWPYIISIVSNPFLLAFLKKEKIILLERSIPYQVPKLNEAYKYYSEPEKILDEELKPLGKKSILNTIKYGLVTFYRKYDFNIVDGHLCYIPDGIDIISSYGVPKDKIRVTLNSPVTEHFLEAAKELEHQTSILPENPYRLIHIGRLVKWKRVDLLIRAVSKLKDTFPETELIVVGDGPERKSLEQLSQELGIRNAVHFTGALYGPLELGKQLKASSIYVLAGTGGLSINDAMCFAKPIVVSEGDGTEKVLVKEGINGTFFSVGDLESLVEKITKLYNKKDALPLMGQASLDIIKTTVNEDIVVKNFVEAFKYFKNSR